MIFTQGRTKMLKSWPQWHCKPGPMDHEANDSPTQLSQHSVASLNLHGIYKVMLYLF